MTTREMILYRTDDMALLAGDRIVFLFNDPAVVVEIVRNEIERLEVIGNRTQHQSKDHP